MKPEYFEDLISLCTDISNQEKNYYPYVLLKMSLHLLVKFLLIHFCKKNT